MFSKRKRLPLRFFKPLLYIFLKKSLRTYIFCSQSSYHLHSPWTYDGTSSISCKYGVLKKRDWKIICHVELSRDFWKLYTLKWLWISFACSCEGTSTRPRIIFWPWVQAEGSHRSWRHRFYNFFDTLYPGMWSQFTTCKIVSFPSFSALQSNIVNF